jgi:hypothetical protein
LKPGDGPFFIVGVHRSGTTLLRYMLSSHTRIYIPPESDFIPRFFLKHPSQPIDAGRAEKILKMIFSSYRFVKEWRGEPPNPQRFVGSLPDLRPATFLDALYREYAAQYGAQRWGDKTPVYTSYMDLIDEIFPGARFIHIIRDGRDVALSMIETWGDKKLHVDPYYAAASWEKRIRQALNSTQKLEADRYFQLRYEELVADPEPVLKNICHFLGEEFQTSMSNPQILGKQRIAPDTFHDKIRRPPNTRSVGRWRRDLPLKDQRIVQKVCGDTLSYFNYELFDMGPMNLNQRLRFMLLKAKYNLLQSGRKLLQFVGVFPPN